MCKGLAHLPEKRYRKPWSLVQNTLDPRHHFQIASIYPCCLELLPRPSKQALRLLPDSSTPLFCAARAGLRCLWYGLCIRHWSGKWFRQGRRVGDVPQCFTLGTGGNFRAGNLFVWPICDVSESLPRCSSERFCPSMNLFNTWKHILRIIYIAPC